MAWHTPGHGLAGLTEMGTWGYIHVSPQHHQGVGYDTQQQ